MPNAFPSRQSALDAVATESFQLITLDDDVYTQIQEAIAARLGGERVMVVCPNRRRFELLQRLVSGEIGADGIQPLFQAASRNQWLAFFADKGLVALSESCVVDEASVRCARAITEREIEGNGLQISALRDDEINEFFVAEFLFELGLAELDGSGMQPRELIAQPYDAQLPDWLNYDRTARWAGGAASALPLHLLGLVTPYQYAELALTLASLQPCLAHGARLTLIGFEPPPPALQAVATFAWYELQEEDDCLDVFNRFALAGEEDWFLRIHAGYLYPGHLLPALQHGIGQLPQAGCLYGDTVGLTPDGQPTTPAFYPDFDVVDLHQGYQPEGAIFIHRPTFAALGGYRRELDGAEEFEWLLRLVEMQGNAAIAHLDEVLCYRPQQWAHPYIEADTVAAQRDAALSQHLQRTLPTVQIARTATQQYHLEMVTAFTASVAVLAVCRRKENAYRDLIAGTDQPTARWELLAATAETSAWDVWHAAAMQSWEDWLLLLDFHDAEPNRPDWLTRLMSLAENYQAGVIAPALGGEGGLQGDCGWVRGLHNQAAAPLRVGHNANQATWLGINQRLRTVSAVSPRGFLVRRTLLLDWMRSTTQFGPASLGLHVQAQGGRLLWDATTQLSRLSIVTPTINQQSVNCPCETLAGLIDRHGVAALRDPAFNRRLSLESPYLSVESRAFAVGAVVPSALPRVLACLPSQREDHRLTPAIATLSAAGRIQGWVTRSEVFQEISFVKAQLDGLVVAHGAGDAQQLHHAARHLQTRLLYDLDMRAALQDGVDDHNLAHWVAHVRQQIAGFDGLITSSSALAELIAPGDMPVYVLPTSLSDASWRRLAPARRQTAKPRVGWTQLPHTPLHYAEILPIISRLAAEVDWVWLGDCPQFLRPYLAEQHALPIGADYATALAQLDLDLALAWLPAGPRNAAMDARPLLEFGALGYPVLCSNLPPYQVDLPVWRLDNHCDDWVDAIRTVVADRDVLAQHGDQLRDWVRQHGFISTQLDAWAPVLRG